MMVGVQGNDPCRCRPSRPLSKVYKTSPRACADARKLERSMGIEPTTSTLARSRSTTGLTPQLVDLLGTAPRGLACKASQTPSSQAQEEERFLPRIQNFYERPLYGAGRCPICRSSDWRIFRLAPPSPPPPLRFLRWTSTRVAHPTKKKTRLGVARRGPIISDEQSLNDWTSHLDWPLRGTFAAD